MVFTTMHSNRHGRLEVGSRVTRVGKEEEMRRMIYLGGATDKEEFASKGDTKK